MLHFSGGKFLATEWEKFVIPNRRKNRVDVIPNAIRYSTATERRKFHRNSAQPLRPTCRENRCLRYIRVALFSTRQGRRRIGEGCFPFLPSARNESPEQARRVAVQRNAYDRNCGSLGSTPFVRASESRLCYFAADIKIFRT